MKARSMRMMALTLLGSAILALSPVSFPACPSKEGGSTASAQNRLDTRAEQVPETQTGCETLQMRGGFPLGILVLGALIDEVTAPESSEWLSAKTLSSRPWVMSGLMRIVSVAASFLGEVIGDDEVAEAKAEHRQTPPPSTSPDRDSSASPFTPRA
jgi:hypothetical protein